MEKINVAVIGLGYRGFSLLKLLSQMDFFRVIAVADPDKEAFADFRECFCDKKQIPGFYTGDDNCHEAMLKSESPDVVFVSSPWHLHYKHATAVLNSGYHLALEIKGSLFEGEYQQLNHIAEQRKLKIYPLENTVFMRSIMAVANMVAQDVLGDIIFTQGAYRHDLRDILANKSEYESNWRIKYYETPNGDIYPTHSVGPLCLMLNINRGEKFKYLTSFATKAGGFNTYFSQRTEKGLPAETADYAMGDVITTIISTTSGAQITLLHDTTLPRPRSLLYEVQGTKGIWNSELKSIYIEGISPKEQWEEEEKYITQYEHPYWKAWGKEALEYDTHHQGMDYIMLKALCADFFDRTVFPVSIKDMAVWADISLLSKKSIEEKRTIEL